MLEYKCECSEKVIPKGGISIKYIEGKGAVHDIKCEDCDEYMKLANPKSGAPKFRQKSWSKYWVILFMISIGGSSCSPSLKHRRIQSRDYCNCWCVQASGGTEWCCPGSPPETYEPL